jgi:hypothetical protein
MTVQSQPADESSKETSRDRAARTRVKVIMTDGSVTSAARVTYSG